MPDYQKTAILFIACEETDFWDYVLDNLNLTIPERKVTAIVGASGGGKTTLVKLLLGFYEPNRGV